MKILNSMLTGALLLASVNVYAEGETVYNWETQKKDAYIPKKAGKAGGTFIMSLTGNPKVINPVISQDTNSRTLEYPLFMGLMTYDEESLKLQPSLAESLTISPDAKTYTFKLYEQAKWSDGSPITAEDVVWTYNTTMDPKVDAAASRAYYTFVEKMETVDTHTVKVTVKQPEFDTIVNLITLIPISKKQYEGETDFNKAKAIMNPVSSGPYVLKEFKSEQYVILEKNKNWWAKDLPQNKNQYAIDTLKYKISPNTTVEYEKLVQGELDYFNLPAQQYGEKVLGVDKDKFDNKPNGSKAIWAGVFDTKFPKSWTYAGFNFKNPLFKSLKTRKALAMLVDYKQISDQVYFGQVIQPTSPFGSFSPNSDIELRKPGKMLVKNDKAALKLLKEDGWIDSDKNGILDKMIDGKKVDFKFSLKFNSNNPARSQVAQIMKENFKKAGVIADVIAVEWNAYLEDLDNRKMDMWIMGWGGGNPVSTNARQTWHTDSEKEKGSNMGAYSNPKVDELIDIANKELNPEKRNKVMQEINRLIYADVPYIFLAEVSKATPAFNKKVKAEKYVLDYSNVSANYGALYSVE